MGWAFGTTGAKSHHETKVVHRVALGRGMDIDFKDRGPGGARLVESTEGLQPRNPEPTTPVIGRRVETLEGLQGSGPLQHWPTPSRLRSGRTTGMGQR